MNGRNNPDLLDEDDQQLQTIEPQPNGNMDFWDSVSNTDVAHTKQVDFGRKFTAIDAHSQIMEATRVFGPVGTGWGYRTEYGFYDTTKGETFIWCDLSLWYRLGNSDSLHSRFGPVRGMAVVQGMNKEGELRPSDNDAGKKAMTDALTKSLSHLGFNADVFLGRFDDTKYVDKSVMGHEPSEYCTFGKNEGVKWTDMAANQLSWYAAESHDESSKKGAQAALDALQGIELEAPY
jgi:hypothetical protein